MNITNFINYLSSKLSKKYHIDIFKNGIMVVDDIVFEIVFETNKHFFYCYYFLVWDKW